LGEHPEWQGDWEMPPGIEQVAVNPKTGAPALPDDPDKRIELFINGTSPQGTSTEEPELEASPETQEPPPLPQETLSPPLLEPSPEASPRARAPKSGTGGVERLEGTITLDIDPTTGLIAVETCPVIRTKTFVLGTEPRKYCGPEYHKAKAPDPSSTRPRLTASPQR
jgi:hypothetical protein